MSSSAVDGVGGSDTLRERLPNDSFKPRKATSPESAQSTVLQLNKAEAISTKRDEEKKTYGRTPDGTVFTVPQTHDMVTQLLSPTQPKNVSDVAVLVVLGSFVGMLVLLPNAVSVPLFAILFIFWRTCYNAGIGYLLHEQSNHRKLTAWAKRSRIFESPSTGKNPHPWLYRLIRREMEAKIPKDYNFEEAPLEYNTWLLFRRLVDLILMSDFVSYCCFAIACASRPAGENTFVFLLRWSSGIVLFLFNLWVKLDAHRVVKDYAWYWGDFFYMIDQELTFDGVFEMAPHPMYSVGYAGFYGISLMAASYKVLFISILGHAAQFAFLTIVENPHIEKIYNPPNRVWQIYFVVLAVVSRLWYSLGIGFILDRQSNKKKWTRHFVKYGESTEEAWRQWKGIYHFSMTMTYTTFICACLKMYHMPPDWTYGMALLRHVFGAALIALQLWTIVSIYDSLGEFGWFFGDFFFDQKPKLTYSGIYRFLNNPERVLGLAGVWGAAIITWSRTIFSLALVSHVLTLAFIQFIERPHMQKLYGQTLRQDSGVSRSINRSLPSPFRNWKGSVDRAMEDFLDQVEDFVDSARPKIVELVDALVEHARSILRRYPTRITISRATPDMATVNLHDYNMEVFGTRSSAASSRDRTSGRESEVAQKPQEFHADSQFRTLVFQYGTPIRVKWQAPVNHSPKDWIGLYMVADNASREVTRLSSQGRWISTTKDSFDISTADKGIIVDDHIERDSRGVEHRCGEVTFSGDKLWWTQGVFEFRYHYAGGHHVMAISLPFEVKIAKFDELEVPRDESGMAMRKAIEQELLPVVQNCFDRDPDFAPSTAHDEFGDGLEREGRYAKRVVFAVHMMFGIEFAPEVVLADGSVKNLAWRISNAKRVLQPYSMSPAKGRSSPA
ncbi:hypothetical protein ANO11243_066030 [Dothideomycetidae sp. 11243]|nr:hypothetical protein ANO11243_066030 [fungal sp. No.11243]